VQKAVAVLVPDSPAPGVEVGGEHVGRAGTVLRRGDGGQRDGDRLDADGRAVPGVGVAGGLPAGAVGVAVDSVVGRDNEGLAEGGAGEVLQLCLLDRGAGFAALATEK
jgi:hypothetical protein